MKLEQSQQNEVKAQISEFLEDYAEKTFDHDKFFVYFFAIYSESANIEVFETSCEKELPEFFGENTKNFINEVLRILPISDDNPKLENQVSKVSTNRNRDVKSNSDDENFSDRFNDGYSNDDDEDQDFRRRHLDDSSHEPTLSENPSLSKNNSELKPLRSNQKPPGPSQPNNIQPSQPKDIRKNPPPVVQPGMKMPPYGNWPNPYPTGPYPMYPMPYMPPQSFPPMYPPTTIMPPIKPPEKNDEYDPLKGKPQNQNFRQPNNNNDVNKKRKNSRAEEEPKPIKVHVSDDNTNKQAQKVVSTEPVDPNKPKTTVYIKNIPDYYNNVEALNKQFKKYGPIVNIKVDPKAKMSTIEFVRPKHAKQALGNKPLFGNKEILLTDDPNMTPEDEANEQKKEKLLQSKFNFLVEIKKFIPETRRNVIMDLITGLKQAQKTKEVPENLTQFVDDPIFDLGVNFSQSIEDVPANDQATLKTKLESYGKLENFKLNPKTKVAEFKYFSLDHAKKAFEELSVTMKIKYVNDAVWEMIKKIKEFEEKFCSKK